MKKLVTIRIEVPRVERDDKMEFYDNGIIVTKKSNGEVTQDKEGPIKRIVQYADAIYDYVKELEGYKVTWIDHRKVVVL